MLSRYFALVTVVASAFLFSDSAYGQPCLHGQSESASNRQRRQRALRVASVINMAQAQALRVDPQQRGYRPLEELANVPFLPRGFTIQFHTDSETYTFSIKDTLDPCRFAVFSDQDGFVYEAIAARQGMIVPVTDDDEGAGETEPRKREFR